MITRATIGNFGPLRSLDWPNAGPLNLVIGPNACGKTFLLKALYCAAKTIEEHRRGDDNRSAAEILADRLYWTFQAEKIGDLVSRHADGPLSMEIETAEGALGFAFGKGTTRDIGRVALNHPPREANSIFLPAKEVLSLHAVILKSRETDKSFGFDDTYLDLARALRLPTTQGRNFVEFAESRDLLKSQFGGWVDYDDASGRWHYCTGTKQADRFPIGVTAEGMKKVLILERLLGSRFIGRQSMVFIDEPESALHPAAISRFMEVLAALARGGMQFFMASHSYFVVKKLYLIAREQGVSIPVLLSDGSQWSRADLKDGMPDNPIIAESVRLYEEEMEHALR